GLAGAGRRRAAARRARPLRDARAGAARTACSPAHPGRPRAPRGGRPAPVSRLFPWGATDRLAALQAAPAPPTARAPDRAPVAAAERHARRLDAECLLLYAGANVPSPRVAALHAAALASQPSMGYPGDKYQAGLEPIDEIEVAAAAAMARLMRARFAELRPTS